MMRWLKGGPEIPVLRFSGVIGMATPLKPGLSLATVAGAIERAFKMKSPAVAMVVNSPGGSPVQSRLIYRRIRALAEERSKPVYVFAEDVMASGGYLLAMAGDEIYADESSIVGSIGVVSAGFGFDRAIARLGIERRVYTAGEHKMALDAFQPEKPDEVERLKALQREVHQDFVALVRERRAGRLTGENLFTGEIWSGRRAAELGLVDGLADVRGKMRALYGENVRLRPMSQEAGLLRRLLRGPALGHETPPRLSLAEEVLSTLEARALWARFGL